MVWGVNIPLKKHGGQWIFWIPLPRCRSILASRRRPRIAAGLTSSSGQSSVLRDGGWTPEIVLYIYVYIYKGNMVMNQWIPWDAVLTEPIFLTRSIDGPRNIKLDIWYEHQRRWMPWVFIWRLLVIWLCPHTICSGWERPRVASFFLESLQKLFVQSRSRFPKRYINLYKLTNSIPLWMAGTASMMEA